MENLKIGGWHICDVCRSIVDNGKTCFNCASVKDITEDERKLIHLIRNSKLGFALDALRKYKSS